MITTKRLIVAGLAFGVSGVVLAGAKSFNVDTGDAWYACSGAAMFCFGWWLGRLIDLSTKRHES